MRSTPAQSNRTISITCLSLSFSCRSFSRCCLAFSRSNRSRSRSSGSMVSLNKFFLVDSMLSTIYTFRNTLTAFRRVRRKNYHPKLINPSPHLSLSYPPNRLAGLRSRSPRSLRLRSSTDEADARSTARFTSSSCSCAKLFFILHIIKKLSSFGC